MRGYSLLFRKFFLCVLILSFSSQAIAQKFYPRDCYQGKMPLNRNLNSRDQDNLARMMPIAVSKSPEMHFLEKRLSGCGIQSKDFNEYANTFVPTYRQAVEYLDHSGEKGKTYMLLGDGEYTRILRRSYVIKGIPPEFGAQLKCSVSESEVLKLFQQCADLLANAYFPCKEALNLKRFCEDSNATSDEIMKAVKDFQEKRIRLVKVLGEPEVEQLTRNFCATPVEFKK